MPSICYNKFVTSWTSMFNEGVFLFRFTAVDCFAVTIVNFINDSVFIL